ncbi:olfactory receptor 4B13-like [Conger conger]|uniref:olfactory receptor 4B13-like n=1 Tax=Conger conger TaxID=82655 RepID=UPI002A5A4D5E|nr:olfactory receptor 4B13-like [Conger conger]
MENVSAVTSFIFMAYTEMEDHRYLYILCFLLLYILILLANSVLIIVIFTEKGLHKPMYLFICNLAVNEIYGSTSLLPSIMNHLVSHNYEISLTGCLLQIFFVHSYNAVEFTILAVMGYDRYVAICHPLHYHQLMSHRRMYILIASSWVYPHIYFGLYFILTVRQTFCNMFIESLYCSNFPLVRLSCLDTTLHSIIGLALLVVLPGPHIFMILFSYAQILRICLLASKESQVKALQTCTPHLLAVINYVFGVLFEVIQSRFNMSHVPYNARIFMSLYFLIIPPLFNPVIYGLNVNSIRIQIFQLFNGKKVNHLH